MFEQGLLQELLQYNISQGSAQSRSEVRDLLCLLTLNNADAVVCLNHKLMDSVDGVLKRTGPVELDSSRNGPPGRQFPVSRLVLGTKAPMRRSTLPQVDSTPGITCCHGYHHFAMSSND